MFGTLELEEFMIFNVPDMSCGHCKAAVEKAIADAGGRAQVDLEQKRVQVDGIEADRAQQAIVLAGFQPEPMT